MSAQRTAVEDWLWWLQFILHFSCQNTRVLYKGELLFGWIRITGAIIRPNMNRNSYWDVMLSYLWTVVYLNKNNDVIAWRHTWTTHSWSRPTQLHYHSIIIFLPFSYLLPAMWWQQSLKFLATSQPCTGSGAVILTWFVCWFWCYINRLLAYLTFLLTFILTYLLL